MMTKAEFERLMTAVSNGYAAADKSIDHGNREEFLRHGKWALGVLKRCFHDTDHKSAYKQIVAKVAEQRLFTAAVQNMKKIAYLCWRDTFDFFALFLCFGKKQSLSLA